MLESVTFTLVAVIVLGLFFDYVNGFHDSANAIATGVSTRALSPRQAVVLAASMNVLGAYIGTNVASTVSSGLVETSLVNDQMIILTALIGAIVWNLTTWYFGLPSSSSHALVGGLIGSVVVYRGWSAVLWGGVWSKVLLPGLVSPLLGLVVGYLIMVSMLWIFRRANPYSINERFRVCQRASACCLALAHGTNDAQKVMGIITLALVTQGIQHEFHVQWWVKLMCATMMGLGTAAGGWRIIKTLGCNVVKLTPVHGFAAELTSSLAFFVNAYLGMPVSTTHVITCAIMGVGATKRLSAVRWGVTGNIATAWVLTIPASAMASAVAYLILRLFVRG